MKEVELSKFQEEKDKQGGLFIRTLECSKCKRFDGVYVSEEELRELVENNDLEIGNIIVDHGDHERVIYFLPNGKYLGDSIIEKDDTIFLEKTIKKQQNKNKRNILNRFKKSLFSALFGKQLKISITGSSQVGKTTLARFLATGKPLKEYMDISLPTLGKSIKSIKIGRSSITLFDLGGQKDFWRIWSDSIRESNFYIHIIDGSRYDDKEQIKALKHLASIVSKVNIPGIILINKLDRYLTKEVEDFLKAEEVRSLINQFNLYTEIIEISLFEGVAYIKSDGYLEERDLSDYLKELIRKL